MDIRTKLFKPANAHVLMVSFLLGGIGALLIGMQQALKTAEESIRPSLKAVVFIQAGIPDQQAAKWANTLPAADPEIDSITFVSRDEALKNAQGNPSLIKSLILLRENPFPSSVIIRYKDVAWLERPEPVLSLRNAPEVQEIRWDPEVRSVFRSLRQWRAWLVRISAFAMMMLLVWSLFGVYRFLAARSSAFELFVQLGLGLIGGSLSMATWTLALHGIGPDAALYRPGFVSFWPLLTASMAALATFGWEVPHEH